MLTPRNIRRIASAGSSSNIETRTTAFSLKVNTQLLDRLPQEVREKVKAVIKKATQDIKGATQKNIRDKNIYDTGFLHNSVTGDRFENEGMTGYVDVGAHYGIYHEFGTSRMAARPFLGPAVDFVGPSFIEAVKQAVREACDSK